MLLLWNPRFKYLCHEASKGGLGRDSSAVKSVKQLFKGTVLIQNMLKAKRKILPNTIQSPFPAVSEDNNNNWRKYHHVIGSGHA